MGAIYLISLQAAHGLPQIMRSWHWIAGSSQLKWCFSQCYTACLKPFIIPVSQSFLKSVQRRAFCFSVFFLIAFLIFRSSSLQKVEFSSSSCGSCRKPFRLWRQEMPESISLWKSLYSCWFCSGKVSAEVLGPSRVLHLQNYVSLNGEPKAESIGMAICNRRLSWDC